MHSPYIYDKGIMQYTIFGFAFDVKTFLKRTKNPFFNIINFCHCNIIIQKSFFRYPEKPQQDIQQSEVYKMVQEADGQGKPALQMPLKVSNGRDFSPEVASQSADVEHPRFLKSRKTGLSFRVLQWLTETDDLDDETVMKDIDSRHTVDIFFAKHSRYSWMTPESQAFLHFFCILIALFILFRSLNIFLFDIHPIKIARISPILIILVQDSSTCIRFWSFS